MPEEQPDADALHERESLEAVGSKDPAKIKDLYHRYGDQLQEGLKGRESEVIQHGSVKVAIWQARKLRTQARDGVVLDIGCGPRPEVSFRLAGDADHIVCMDLGHGMLSVARRVAETEGIGNASFILGDAENVPFRSDSFDVVVADDVIEHVPNPDKLVEETGRVVSDTGVVSISTPNGRAVSVLFDKAKDALRGKLGPPEKYYVVASHVHEFTKSELRDLGSTYFNKVWFGAVGWENPALLHRLVSAVTSIPGLRGLNRHWILQARSPRSR